MHCNDFERWRLKHILLTFRERDAVSGLLSGGYLLFGGGGAIRGLAVYSVLVYQQGVLPEDYRSQWCKDFFDNKGCPRGVHCPFAHNLQQLRIDAAIKTGTVREDFKQNFCADEHQKGTLCLLELPFGIAFFLYFQR